MRGLRTTINRRNFCASAASLALAIVAAKLPIVTVPNLQVLVLDHEFVIVNGWVLTRKDISMSEPLPDVV